MKIPRDVKADDLINGLVRLGFRPTRQTGSHVRLTCSMEDAELHITVPRHGNLKIGTLNSILNDVAGCFAKTRDDIIAQLWPQK